MKTLGSNSRPRRCGGMMLIECLVYIFVFAVVLNIGLVAFYIFWDHSTALRYTTDDISRALQVGETWRADIRSATGKIEAQTSPDGALLKIPRGRSEIIYRYSDNTLFRKAAPGNSWTPVLSHVKASQMESENRNQINAWHWEVELIPHRAKAKTRLLLTFEAVPPARP